MLWLLQFLPDWVYYGILGLGLVGLAVTYFLDSFQSPQSLCIEHQYSWCLYV